MRALLFLSMLAVAACEVCNTGLKLLPDGAPDPKEACVEAPSARDGGAQD